MAIKIMPLPAAQAAEFIAPYDGIVSAVFVDADGNPIDLTGGGSDAPTTIPQGALIPGDGISLVRDRDSGVVTASIKDKGVTAGMLADGVAVSGPKGDPGAPGAKGADGKSVTAIVLTADAAGKITGGTVTFSDKSTAAITVTTATNPAADQPSGIQ